MTESGGAPRILLAGPTGIGKTALAVELAQRFALEIISADSMQIYRGLEIGTAQPTAEERAKACFHGCGEREPAERYDVQQFLERCARAEAEIVARGRTPLYVGGTGLYLRALRWGLCDQPESDPALRARLENELIAEGPEAMHARLLQCDPAAARRIGPGDPIRLVRAMELNLLTGRRLEEVQRQWANPQARFPHRLVVLTAPRELLRRRIARRTTAMLTAGWIDEARRLLEAGHQPDLHCFKALGYREIFEHLAGRVERRELEWRIATATQQFAKRQMIWFRRERPALWLRLRHDAGEGDPQAPERCALENLLAKVATPFL